MSKHLSLDCTYPSSQQHLLQLPLQMSIQESTQDRRLKQVTVKVTTRTHCEINCIRLNVYVTVKSTVHVAVKLTTHISIIIFYKPPLPPSWLLLGSPMLMDPAHPSQQHSVANLKNNLRS